MATVLTACDKKGYRSAAQARRALRRLQDLASRNPAVNRPTRVYACYPCGAWHLTSQR